MFLPVNISLICKHLSHHASHPPCLVTLSRILESALTPPLPSNWPFENYFQLLLQRLFFHPKPVSNPSIQPTIVTASLFSLALLSPSSRMPEKLMLLSSSARLTCLYPSLTGRLLQSLQMPQTEPLALWVMPTWGIP